MPLIIIMHAFYHTVAIYYEKIQLLEYLINKNQIFMFIYFNYILKLLNFDIETQNYAVQGQHGTGIMYCVLA